MCGSLSGAHGEELGHDGVKLVAPTMGDMLMVPMMGTYPRCHPHTLGELLIAPMMGC